MAVVRQSTKAHVQAMMWWRWVTALTAVVALTSGAGAQDDPCFHGDNEMLPLWWPSIARGNDTPADPEAPTVTYPPPPTRLSGPALNARRQPTGALSGRIVYFNGGHGWTADIPDSAASDWYTQRGNSGGVVEDYGNMDQASLFAAYAWNAGATVVPVRPIGHQKNEVVIDQDDAAVTYTGTWANMSQTPAYEVAPGSSTQTHRTATTTSGAATATARFTPNIPVAGYYPTYAWALDGPDRVNQLYRVGHAGGVTETRVNHRRVGKGWVWLGTYYYEAGSQPNQYVEITNNELAGDSGSVVVADAVRFGNGMGSIARGSLGVSGFAREEEQLRYWAEAAQATPSSVYDGSGSDGSDNVSGAPKYAAFMNREQDGGIHDRIFVSFHSNAGGGRGADGLYNDEAPGVTNSPNQFLLATLLGREINDDMWGLSNSTGTDFFPLYTDWTSKLTNTFSASFAYGELRWDTINEEMECTIIEVAFHDSADDQPYLKDMLARRAIARATLQGVIRFFNQVAGGPLAMPPDEPRNLRALNATDASGNLVLNWTAPLQVASERPATTPGNIGGDAPTGYNVYSSANGRDFSLLAALGNTTTYSHSGVGSNNARYYMVTAVNAGGESFPSNIAGARVESARPPVLIVDGFDRTDQGIALSETVSGIPNRPSLGTFQRVISHRINNFSYVVEHGRAISEGTEQRNFDSVPNDAVIAGTVALTDYDTVVWILGRESENTAGGTVFDATERTAITNFLNAGGNLMVSGSDWAYDLGRAGQPAAETTFLNTNLRTTYIGDSANTYSVNGSVGGIFNGLSMSLSTFDGPVYDARFLDRLGAGSGAVVAMTYSGGSGGNAAIVYDGTPATGRVVGLGFPFETITSATTRADVMSRTLAFFDTPGSTNTPPTLSSPLAGIGVVRDGAPVNNASFATVNDADQAAGTVGVSVSGAPVGIVASASNTGGTIGITVEAECAVVPGAYVLNLVATDSGGNNDIEPFTVTVSECMACCNVPNRPYMTSGLGARQSIIDAAGVGAGSPPADYASLEAAIAAVNATPLTGGDWTFLVRSNLTEFNNVALGQATNGNRLFFKPYAGTNATITFAPTTAQTTTGVPGHWVIGVNQLNAINNTTGAPIATNNVTIDGANGGGSLAITNSASNAGPTVSIVGNCDGLELKNLSVTSVVATTIAGAIRTNCIDVGGGDLTPDNLLIENCVVNGGSGSTGVSMRFDRLTGRGTLTDVTTDSDNVTVRNCVTSQGSSGIFSAAAQGVVFEGNTINSTQTGTGTDGRGIMFFGTQSSGRTNVLRNNRVGVTAPTNATNNGAYALYLEANGASASNRNVFEVYNNLIHVQLTGTGTPAAGILAGIRCITANTDYRLWHNSIHLRQSSVAYTGLDGSKAHGIGIPTAGFAGVADIRNNLLRVNQNGAVGLYFGASTLPAGSSVTTESNNVWLGTGVSFGRRAGTDANLATWRTLSLNGANFDLLSTTFDPRDAAGGTRAIWISETDLKFTAVLPHANIEILGQALAGNPVPTDVDGFARHTTTPFKGADEWAVADIFIDPASDNHSFGNVAVGGFVDHTFVVSNRGTSTMTVNAINASGSGEFTRIAPASLPANVAAGATVNVTIRFAPTLGPKTATFTVTTSNDPWNGSVVLDVDGTGVAPPTVSDMIEVH